MSLTADELDPQLASLLLSDAGREWLMRAASLDPAPQARLGNLMALRRSLTPEQAGAVLEQAELRRTGPSKFSRSSAVVVIRAGLEQASAELVAAHRARRLGGRRLVTDLTCGIGADALALAGTAQQVIGLDL